jgi:hypothetical protein
MDLSCFLRIPRAGDDAEKRREAEEQFVWLESVSAMDNVFLSEYGHLAPVAV